MPRTRAIDLYLKPGIEEDDRIHTIWLGLRDCGRPQEVLRRAMMLGLRSMAASGELPHSIALLVAGPDGAALPLSARSLFTGRPAVATAARARTLPVAAPAAQYAAPQEPKAGTASSEALPAGPAAAIPEVVRQAPATAAQAVLAEPPPAPAATPAGPAGIPGAGFVDKHTTLALGSATTERYPGDGSPAPVVVPRPAAGPRRLGRIM